MRNAGTIFILVLAVAGLLAVQTPAWAGQPPGVQTKVDMAALARDGRWLELLTAATAAVQKNPSDPEPEAFRLQAMRMLGESDAAVKQADEAVKRFPNDAHIILERSWILTFRGNWPLALADAMRASEIAPKLMDALTVQGISCREMHDWDNAISVYTKILNMRPGDAHALQNRGRAYVEKKMWQEAKADLDKSISLNKKSAEAFYYRGRMNAGAGKLGDATKDLTRAIKLKPESPAPYIARAEVLARGGLWEAAAKDAYTAIVLGSRDARPYLTACRASVALGDWDALSEYAAGGIRTVPENPDFYHFAGRAYREKSDLDRALAAYSQAVKLAPGDAGLLLERALTAIMLRRYPQAADDCTASLAIRTSSLAYALRGLACLKTGSLDGALEESTNALTLNPKEIMALLVRANVYLSQNNVREAVSESRKALMLDPAQPWAYVTCGSALTAAGKREEGLKLLNEAVKMAPRDGEAYLVRGRCLAALGRRGDAVKDFERAAAADPALAPAARAERDKLL